MSFYESDLLFHGYGNMTTDHEIKKINPVCPIILGGSGVTVYPKYFMEKQCIDFALIGEIEDTLPPFISELKKNSPNFQKIAGLCYKTDKILHDPSTYDKSKHSSSILATSSEPTPPRRTPSSIVTSFPVFLTDSAIISKSSGTNVLGSIISILIP